VTSRWKLLANYSYINLIMEQAPDSLDPTFSTQNGLVPHNQFMIRSQWFMPHDTQLINTAYYVDQLPASSIDSYLRFDTQVIWQAMNGVEVSLVGQNLLDRQHEEFGAAPNGVVNEIPRAYYARLTLRY
jgi:iron complex outermembrane receptor protein